MIKYKKKPSKFVPEEDKQIKRKINFFTDVLSGLDVRKMLFVM